LLACVLACVKPIGNFILINIFYEGFCGWNLELQTLPRAVVKNATISPPAGIKPADITFFGLPFINTIEVN
jgi:hypothetical protein